MTERKQKQTGFTQKKKLAARAALTKSKNKYLTIAFKVEMLHVNDPTIIVHYIKDPHIS